MLSLVLAAASAAEAHAAAPSEGPAGLLQKFGVEWQFVIWQFISFAILAGVLYQFAIKPIIATLDERNAKIAEGLKNAAATTAKLAQAQLDAAAIAKQAQLEAAKFAEEARQTAREFLEAQQKDATARANDLIVKAQQAIVLEHKKMLEAARLEVARLVVATTERVLAKELSDEERTRYNEAAARELIETKD
jgi:F-type H+-transporting ATPase subunit b